MIARRWDWFIPIIPPSNALMDETTKVNDIFICIKNLKMISGASFCQVAKIIHEIHDRDVITEGNQKCMGTIPSLSRIEATNK